MDGRFLIRTNEGGATNFKLVQAPVNNPGRANWKDLIPHRETTLIDGLDLSATTWWCMSAKTRCGASVSGTASPERSTT